MPRVERKPGPGTPRWRRRWGGLLLGVTAVLLCVPQAGCGDLMCGGTCEDHFPLICSDFSVDKCPEGCSTYDRCGCKDDNCSDATANDCRSWSEGQCGADPQCEWGKRCSELKPSPCDGVHIADACKAVARCRWHQECD